jgi:hypothetical protein
MTTPADGIALPSTSESPAPVTPRPRRRGWSLRGHLLSIVAVAVVLVALAGVLLTFKDYARARDGAVNDVRFEAQLAAGNADNKAAVSESLHNSITDLRALIVKSGISLGQADLASLPPDKCNLTFQEFRIFSSGVLHIVLPDGRVLCSSKPGLVDPGSHPYAGATWLTPVVQNSSATVVGPLRDPVTHQWALFVAAPIPAPGQPASAPPPGVLAVALDLTPLASALHSRFGGVPRVEFLVTDSKRDRVVSDSVNPVGNVARALPAREYLRADAKKGAIIRGPDGTTRLYAGASVSELNWHVYAGIPKSEVYKQANASLKDHAVAGLIIIAGLALVTLSGIFTVARR